jgi:hypothetical protein
MDIHIRIAAVLHIVMGLIGAAFLALGGLAFGGFAAFVTDAHVPRFVFGLGVMFLALLILLALADAAAGVAVLKGSRNARVFLIVFSLLGLLKFPFGTALGGYSLWALLRKQPAPGSAP